MPTKDVDRAHSRFISAVKRIRAGLVLERSRIIDVADAAPALLEGQPYEVKDLTGVPDNDIDYYAFELGRLQDSAREMIKVFDSPPELVAALGAFELALPKLRQARNPLTHPSDDARLDRAAWFSAFVNVHPDGSVEYLFDPRYQDHEAALALADTLIAYLRAGIQAR